MYGRGHHMPYKMSAGENLEATLDVYFDENDLRAHDISIVVQAEKSPVKISIPGKDKGEGFPQYKLSPDVTIKPMRNREHSPAFEPDLLPDQDDTAADDQSGEKDDRSDVVDDGFDPSTLPNYS